MWHFVITIVTDFNARVGGDSQVWDRGTGQNRIGKGNSHGPPLLKTCAKHNFIIIANHNMTSWMHPPFQHWHFIDFVIVRKRDRQDVSVTKAICGTDYWTDQRLIITKFNILIQPKRCPRRKAASKQMNDNFLKNVAVKQGLFQDLDSKLDQLNFNCSHIKGNWSAYRDLLYITALK